jgi:polyisoprenoid-binding protein YceI
MILCNAFLSAALLCSLVALPAQAASYRADSKSSTLTFSSSYQGESFTGRFGRFDANIAFDPANLATSNFDVTITLGSADTQNSERDDALKGADFFNVAKMPTAHYFASKFRSLGGNRYAADGALTLRGVTKPVVLSFTWTPGATPALVGDANVNRLDFGVGGGQWADTATIGNAVKVHTALKLVAASGAAVPVKK